ncbi:MAG: hypothetical protein JJE13_12055 [Thermoleophilia bacterium]|nr:hypothetical protein [Thermoleophilia bacterium]
MSLAVGFTLVVTLATLLMSANLARSAETKCIRGERMTVDAGIARANACFTKTLSKNGSLYTAKFADQPAGVGVDLNGFVFGSGGSPKGESITIDTGSREVTSVGQTQMYSRNWPYAGLNPIGVPFRLEFTAPNKGELVIEDMRVGVYPVFKGILAGLISPVTNVETPMAIAENGKGSIGLTVQLSGIFTLKGKPQSATIAVATEIGQGSTLDGFDLELNELDFFKAVILENLKANYSASGNKFGGRVAVRFSFFKPNAQGEGKGIIAGFGIEKGAFNAELGLSGLRIPIGQSGGFLTSVYGGIDLRYQPEFNLLLKLMVEAEFGPKMPVPWGPPAAPIEANAALKFDYKNREGVFRIDGGLKLFKIPVGNAYLGIYTSSGIEFGANVGIGVPSLRDNPRDPFYVGARVDGWIGWDGRFQFEGAGRFSLFGVQLLDGRALINRKVIGGCWKIFWWQGGAVYQFDNRSVNTFGTTCGLDRYKEQFRAGASISATDSRSLTLGKRQVVLRVKGEGGAPRFYLRSPSGEVMKAPVEKDGVKRSDNAFFIDEVHDVTNVALARPEGKWKITAYRGSPTITSVRAGTYMSKEEVEARVVGKGKWRTLVWDSKGQPNTTLTFTELMKGGVENPILVTGEASGRKRFKVTTGALYGERRLRVAVIHGGTPRQHEVLGTYVVKPPKAPAAPKTVRAWRDEQDATVTWSRVAGASNYFVQVRLPRTKKWKGAYARLLGPKARQVHFPDFPSGGVARARVVALNKDGRFGKPGAFSFRTEPRQITLRTAVRRGAHSASRIGDGVGLKTICPTGGHCSAHIRLILGKRAIGSARYQQTPGTFHHLRVRPKSKQLRARLAAGRLKNLEVEVIQGRNGRHVHASSGL